jgi:hypothetical protein
MAKKKVTETNGIHNGTQEAAAPAPAPKKKASAKKAKEVPVVASVSATGEIVGSLQPLIKRPLIAHLPITSSSVVFSDAPPDYNPNLPDPIAANESTCDPFMMSTQDTYEPIGGFQEEIDEDDIEKMKDQLKTSLGPDKVTENKTLIVQPVQTVVPATPAAAQPTPKKKELVQVNPYHTHVELFGEFATKNGCVPDQVETACFWCCHGFVWKPVVIPCTYDESQGVYKVYGNFCTPECAMAHLLNEQIDMNSRWERISWLHHIYCVEGMQRIYPAPGREVLKMFGGAYEVDEFRELCISRKLRVDINYPPMVSLVATMDTKPIDFYETSQKQGGLAGGGIGGSGLRLKRSKPLKEVENTLDSCLNIQIR